MHTFQYKVMADGLAGSAEVITGAGDGFSIGESLRRTNLADIGPDLLSLLEYTAAIWNL